MFARYYTRTTRLGRSTRSSEKLWSRSGWGISQHETSRARSRSTLTPACLPALDGRRVPPTQSQSPINSYVFRDVPEYDRSLGTMPVR